MDLISKFDMIQISAKMLRFHILPRGADLDTLLLGRCFTVTLFLAVLYPPEFSNRDERCIDNGDLITDIENNHHQPLRSSGD